jgi:hypothetical protein
MYISRFVVVTTLKTECLLHLLCAASQLDLSVLSSNVFSQIPSRYNVYEATILNAGLLFDKEISIAWKSLIGHLPSNAQKLWILVFDNSH